MSYFTEKINKIYDDWTETTTQVVGVDKIPPEKISFNYKSISWMIEILKKLGKPSYLDNLQKCKDIVSFYEHGTASGFEKAFITCYDIADEYHKNRLALAFPDFAQARSDYMRGSR